MLARCGSSFTPAEESSPGDGGSGGASGVPGTELAWHLSSGAQVLTREPFFCSRDLLREVPLRREQRWLNYSSRFVLHVSVLRIMLDALGDLTRSVRCDSSPW